MSFREISSETPLSTNHELLIQETSGEQKLVNDVALGVLGYIKYFWYSFLYLIWTICSETDKSIFKDSLVLIPTHNFAIKEELKGYAVLEPQNIAEISGFAESFGFAADAEEVNFTPCDWGKCMGGVVHFLKKTGEVGVEQAAEAFRGGMPIQAAYFQAIHNQYDREIINEGIIDLLIFAIEHRSEISEKKLKAYWNEHFGESSSVILDEIKTYLSEGNDPKKGGFTQAIVKGLRSKGKILGPFYGSIRKVEEHFTGNQNQAEIDDHRFIFQLVGLDIEPICVDTSPHSVIEELSNLKPGRYFLSLSVYSPIGHEVGKHATALVINPDGTFYFLEPNFAVGKKRGRCLQTTIERTFTTYTGISTFNGNPGKVRIFLNRFTNFLKLGPNANPDLSSGFSLYRITEANL